MSTSERSRVLRQRSEKKQNVTSTKTSEPKLAQKHKNQVVKEVDDNLVPEKVVGAIRNENREVCVIVKWKNKEGTDIVPSSIANYRWPNLVIRYYEQRIRWIDV